ncbi:MAG TPA: hypothetical protein VFP72_13600 [Kineosporiaceae bacterium]|nr:hypothetical protein [Kineosporiaceae bacterium]
MRGIFRAAALLTFLAVSVGAVVCATGSGAACPTWPGCHPGDVVPGWQLNPVIEFGHRAVAVSSGPAILLAALFGLRLHRAGVAVRVLPWVALAGAVASGAFGRAAILYGISAWMVAVDVGCALTAMSVMAVAAVRVGGPARTAVAGEPGAARVVTRRAVAATGVLIGLHVTGILVAGTGSFTRCLGWPMWQLVAADRLPWLQVVRLGLAAVAAVLILATVTAARRVARLHRWAGAVGALLATELAVGLVLRERGLVTGLAAAYSVTAAALLWSLALLAAVASRPGPDAADADAGVIDLSGISCRSTVG